MNIFIYLAIMLGISAVLALIAGAIFRKKYPETKTKLKTFAFICLVCCVALYSFGDGKRKNGYKAETLSYYEQQIPYTELTADQQESVKQIIFYMDSLSKDEVEQYMPAQAFYLPQYYEATGATPEDIEYYMETFLYKPEEADTKK